MSGPTEDAVTLARSVLASIPAPSPPEGAPTYDHWGILNWARQANRPLWEAVPAARRFMLRDAAQGRWSAHYQNRNELSEFLDFADWLAENLETATAGADGWMS